MNYRHIFGLIMLQLIGYCSCLISSMTSNGTNPENPLQQESSIITTKQNARTARRGNTLSTSCTTSDGVSGTCMSRFNCLRLGGVAKGYCTTFVGICCETNLNCGQTSRLKRTIIRNPAQLSTSTCSYTIESYNSNVCQLLVEFEKFELQQPTLTDTDLECTDYMQIGDYKLCGDNAQQHLYIPFNVANGIGTITMIFRISNLGQQTNWRLIVTQLECPAVKRRMNLSFLPFVTDNSLTNAQTYLATHNSDLDLLAPWGCDQYFRQSMGTIKTFNYNQNLGTYYMPNMKYTICIKSSSGSTMVEYIVRKFSLSIQQVDTIGFDSDCHPTVTTAERKEDYLNIPQAVLSNSNLRPNYFCGSSIDGGTVLLAPAPFTMYFSSDGKTDDTETGFSIDYRVRSVFG